MLFKPALLLAGVAFSGLASAWPTAPAPLKTFTKNLIYQPPSNYTDPRVLYARSVQLPDNRLLATWENYSPEPPLVWFPIYESLDNGVSWKEVGQVHDQVNNWGLRYQPFLYVLPKPFGGFPKGTVVLAGNSIPTDLSKTQIDIYASTDKGRTWKFVSHVASGGVALPNNGETPVWEPFILIHKDTLILYYADQRDPNHGQILSHQTTKNLRDWSAPVTDAAYPTYEDRPGMPFVTRLPTGDYFYTYEWGGRFNTENYTFPLYYKIAKDPRKFGEAKEFKIVGKNDGSTPISSPNVVWSPVGGKNGTIIVSSSSAPLWTNQALGDVDSWVSHPSPEDAAYTRNLRLLQQNPNYLVVLGAGKLPPSTTNKVTISVIKVTELIKS